MSVPQVFGVHSGGKTVLYAITQGRFVLRCDDLTRGFDTVELDLQQASLQLTDVWAADPRSVYVAAHDIQNVASPPRFSTATVTTSWSTASRR